MAGRIRWRGWEAAPVARATIVVLAIVGAALLLWRLSDVLLLAFAAIIAACGLRGLGYLVTRTTRLPIELAVVAVSIAAALLLVGMVYLLGQQISAQASNLLGALPGQLDFLAARLGIPDLAQQVTERLEGFLDQSGLVERLFGMTIGAVGWLTNLALVLVAGVYLAFRPSFYINGFLNLLPIAVRQRAARTFIVAGHALQQWLLGQMVAMALVGSLITIGLLAIGVPSALALGLLAGILEFIPFLGPWLAAVPALLIVIGDQSLTVVWVGVLYVAVQQLEGNIITPMVQRRAVNLPPVITIFALAAMGTLFGPLGILIATPFAAVVLVAVGALDLLPADHPSRSVLPQEFPGEDGASNGSARQPPRLPGPPAGRPPPQG